MHFSGIKEYNAIYLYEYWEQSIFYASYSVSVHVHMTTFIIITVKSNAVLTQMKRIQT